MSGAFPQQLLPPIENSPPAPVSVVEAEPDVIQLSLELSSVWRRLSLADKIFVSTL